MTPRVVVDNEDGVIGRVWQQDVSGDDTLVDHRSSLERARVKHTVALNTLRALYTLKALNTLKALHTLKAPAEGS